MQIKLCHWLFEWGEKWKYLGGGGGGGVKISYDILTPGLSWDSFWLCQSKSIITIQEIIDNFNIMILSSKYEMQKKLCHRFIWGWNILTPGSSWDSFW